MKWKNKVRKISALFSTKFQVFTVILGVDKQEKSNMLFSLNASEQTYHYCSRIVASYMKNSAFSRVNVSSIFADFR